MHGKIKRPKASDVMKDDVAILKDSTKIADVVKVMNDKRIGSIVITDDAEVPVGIITERDVIRALAGSGKNFFDLDAGQIMSKPLVTIIPSTDIEKIEKEMRRRNIKHLPVVSSGKAVGIVSSRDVVDYLGGYNIRGR